MYAISDPTTQAERLGLTAELEALATELGSLDLSNRAAFHRVRALLESGDSVGALRAIARCEQLATQLRVPFFKWSAGLMRAMWSLMCGWPDAEQQALAACELGTSIELPHARDALALELFEIRYRQGRLGEMADVLRAYVEHSMPHIPAVRAMLALLYSESDLLAEAREQFERSAANGFDLPLDWNWAGSMFHLAEVCGALRDASQAELLYAKLRPLAEQIGVSGLTRCDGSLGHAAGVLAACLQRWEDAERHFEHAVAMNGTHADYDRVNAEEV